MVRYLSIALLVSALALAGFSYWGINTDEGQHAYDEMAAIVPYSVGLLSLILAVAAIGTFWWSARRARS